jgi:putative membrane protein
VLRNGLLKQELLAIITNKKVLIPIIAVLFIPVLYAGMFLWAFWDPYGKMDKLPVAVVNSDTGATMDGEHLKLGDDLVKKLKKSKDFGYKIVSREEGYKGLNNQKYYMLIEIPKDFSENATTLMDKNPKKLELVYVPNEGFNFLSAQIGGTAAEKIRTAVSEKVTETYAETIFDKISDVAAGFHQASDGAGKLSDGSKDLDKGAKDLNNGLKTLAEKSIEFNNGVKSADSGANKLASGSNDLYNGLKTLAEKSIEFNNGMQSADSGAGKLASGSTKLKKGLAEADSKMPLLIDGTKAATEEIKTKLPKGIAAEIGSQLSGSVDKLNGGIDEFKTALGKQITAQMSEQMSEQIAEQMSQQIAAQTIEQYNQQKEKMTQLAQTLIKTANSPEQAQQIQAIFQSALQQPIPTQEELQQQLQKQMQEQLKEQLKSGIPAKLGPGLDKGFEQFKTEVDKQLLGATAGLDTKIKAKTDPVFDQLANGLNAKQTELQNGIHQLYLGSKDLNSGASDLSSGMNKLAAGTTVMLSGEDQLLLGSNQLKLGAFDLSKGMGQLTTGAGALTSGAGKLADGSGQLQDGTTKLTDGATELADKLKDGSKEVAKVKADDKTYDMMAKPVKLDKEEVNRVPNYGSGFTPYFLSLGLFVGALVLTIVFSIREPIITPKNGFTWFGSKFTILASCGLIQALVADAIILGPLGLDVQSVPKFILFSIITSLVFITLIQFLVTLFGDVGRFLAILILIFQLTTSAGTFPLELIPNFLQHFNAFLPMTYTVQGFKAVISSGDFSYMWHNFMILAGYVLAFAGCTLIYLTMRHHVKYGHPAEEN